MKNPEKKNKENRSQKKNKSEWDSVSRWYDRLVGEDGSDFHKTIVIPGVLSLLNPEANEHILDLGCGQGVFCRTLSAKRIRVTGVDISEKLIQEAKKKSAHKPDLETYIVSDAGKIPEISDSSFDGAVSILALQDMESLEDAVAEMTRSVKDGGKLVWVIMHPCFRIPRQSHWGFDEDRKIQYRRIDRYLSSLTIPIQTHPGLNPGIKTSSHHRPLSEYINVLAGNGWCIQKMEEWTSPKKSGPGPRAKAENRAREEFPLFLAISAFKRRPQS